VGGVLHGRRRWRRDRLRARAQDQDSTAGPPVERLRRQRLGVVMQM